MSDIADVSIEFSHIYLNEAFSSEHKKSAEALRKLIEDPLNQEIYKQRCLVVLIDDYNATEELLDVDEFIESLDELGVRPDFVGSEAGLAQYKDDVLYILGDTRDGRSYKKYIETQEKIPCSFMIITWYLLRLGALDLRPDTVGTVGSTSVPFRAKKLVNILPERFMGVEHKALHALSKSSRGDVVENIDWMFFNGHIDSGLHVLD